MIFFSRRLVLGWTEILLANTIFDTNEFITVSGQMADAANEIWGDDLYDHAVAHNEMIIL